VFMSKGKRYTQEFKIEAVKQVTDRGYSVAEVSDRLGICTKTLYHWRSQFSDKPKSVKSSDEKLRIAKLEAELKRVTEERDILKKQGTLPATPSKVRLYPRASR
jgi:transposase